ncbi:MAG TPA: hypothetical protein VMD91_00670 [Candidatus Sulfotelmatobacter sp.]|nr:hypothetical protein [Candidatus Sulfotelmatobacter sp.]
MRKRLDVADIIEGVSRALDKAPIALTWAFGSSKQQQGRHIDVIAVAEGPPPSELLFAEAGYVLHVMIETPRSLRAELEAPRRAVTIRRLASSSIAFDHDGILTKAVLRARELLNEPPPPSVFRAELELIRDVRETFARLPVEAGPTRALGRAVLLERLMELTHLRCGCWPAHFVDAIEALSNRDPELGKLLSAATLDDSALRSLMRKLLANKPQIASWLLPPAALARLSPEDAQHIQPSDLRRMTKLQVLTMKRVHGNVLAPPARAYLESTIGAH